MAKLSKASVYEQMFGTRQRAAGRPREPEDAPLFPGSGEDPLLVTVAKRRAYAIIQEEQKDRLRMLFKVELEVLKQRGTAQVVIDSGIKRRPR